MKIVIALLMAVLASVSGFAQEERPANPVRILTAGQHITPYKIEVTFGKTVHILFPTEVRYVDLGSNNIIAGKADGVENVVRVKAAVKEFPGETNFSVITGDGSFFSFNVVYKEEPSMVNINENSGVTTSKFQMQDLPQDVAKVVDKMNVGEISKAFTMINEKDGKEVCAIVKLKAKINGHKATIAEDYQDLKEIVMDKRREEMLHKWILDKQKHTYVRINENWQKCDFKYPGWIKKD